MDYCYKITENDPFYKGWVFKSCGNESKIIGINKKYTNDYKNIDNIYISTFNCETLDFSPKCEIKFTEYDDFKTVSCYLIECTNMILIDIENMKYTITNKFPYLISEIDGNFIESCTMNNNIYVFHSQTFEYQTGVFIFDIKTNKFNTDDFVTRERISELDSSDSSDSSNSSFSFSDYDGFMHTNKFTNLHNKDITSCFVCNNQLIIKWCNYPNNKLSIYEPDNDIITDITTSSETLFINCGNVVIGRNFYADSIQNMVKLYKYENNSLNYIKDYKICDEKNIPTSCFSYNNKLIYMSYEYYYPFGLIYDENRNTRPNLQITQFDISKILKYVTDNTI